MAFADKIRPFKQLAQQHYPILIIYALLVVFAAFEMGRLGQWILYSITQLLAVLVVLNLLLDTMEDAGSAYSPMQRTKLATNINYYLRVDLVVLGVQCMWAWLIDPTGNWVALIASIAFLYDLFEHFQSNAARSPRSADQTQLHRTQGYFYTLAVCKMVYHVLMFGLALGWVGPYVVVGAASRQIGQFVEDNMDAIYDRG